MTVFEGFGVGRYGWIYAGSIVTVGLLVRTVFYALANHLKK
jgi:hypothetical protein